jgi:hypothetical protein
MASLARTFDLSSIKAASVGGLVIKLLAVCFGQIPRQLNGRAFCHNAPQLFVEVL